MTNWIRVGNFYKVLDPPLKTFHSNFISLQLTDSRVTQRQVSFVNVTSSVVKQIGVIQLSRIPNFCSEEIKIRIEGTNNHAKKIISAAKHLLPSNSISAYDDILFISFPGDQSEELNAYSLIDKMSHLFNYLNNQLSHTEFPYELNIELRQIIDHFFFIDKPTTQHIINEYMSIKPHIHPSKINSTALVKLLQMHISPTELIGEQKLKYRFNLVIKFLAPFLFRYSLTQGEDPNQVAPLYELNATNPFAGSWLIIWTIMKKIGPVYEPILNKAIKLGLTEFVEALLYYGANIFKRTWSHDGSKVCDSPFELAIKSEKQQSPNSGKILSMMENTLTKLRHPLTKPTSTLKLMRCKITSDKKSIKTSFNFSDGITIETEFRHVSQWETEKKESILQKRENIFDEADINFCLNGNFYLETISHDSRLIGFNIFEIVLPKDKNDNTIIFHIIYMLLQPEYRDYHLMRLLKFRFAFALQTLLKNHDVIVFYTPISPGGFYAGSDFLYAPRHQPPEMDRKFQGILNTIYQGKKPVTPKRDGILCYILEEAPANMPGFGLSADVTLNYIFKYLLGGVSKDKDGKIHGLPIYFYIGDENYIKESQFAESDLGIHLAEHCSKLANCIREVLNSHVTYLSQSAVDLGRLTKQSARLFWKCHDNKIVLDNNLPPTVSAKL